MALRQVGKFNLLQSFTFEVALLTVTNAPLILRLKTLATGCNRPVAKVGFHNAIRPLPKWMRSCVSRDKS
jgi:hypothetical protein